MYYIYYFLQLHESIFAVKVPECDGKIVCKRNHDCIFFLHLHKPNLAVNGLKSTTHLFNNF